MQKYQCAECGVAAVVVDGKVIRPCKHVAAGVVANMSATAYGASHVNNQRGTSK